MKDRLDRLERDRADDAAACNEKIGQLKEAVEHIKDTHVSFTYFEAVVEPIRKSMNEIQKDVRQLLGLVRGGKE